jgi:WD40 repeat protein
LDSFLDKVRSYRTNDDAAMSLAGIIKVWNLVSGKEICTLTGHRGFISTITTSYSGDIIISSCSSDNSIIIWELNSNSNNIRLNIDNVHMCVVDPKRDYFIAIAGTSIIKFWWSESKLQYTLFPTEHTKDILSCAISPDSTLLACASRDGNLTIWNTNTGNLIHKIVGHSAGGEYGGLDGCYFSPDGKYVISKAGSGATTVCIPEQTILKIWEVISGREVAILEGHTHWVEDCAISPDSRFAVSVSWDRTIRVWNILNGDCLGIVHIDSTPMRCGFQPDGKQIVVLGQIGVFYFNFEP